MRTRVGKTVKVKSAENKQFRKNLKNLPETYLSTWLNHDSQIIPVIFTETEIRAAKKRAEKNVSTIVGRSILSVIVDH
ncbi:hypothetical protein [Aquirufa nivalisilvae]|uniref:hypothetical protein n=1 Tax=Aquirufa TaxID=2676247 RepID=UPI0022A95450|nr:hypothetical protein [Aquirufa nivalisilvae]MCZ2480050.1 hypothetical protein [Aquirufa nivalisilvae]